MGTVAQIIAYPGGFMRMLIIKKILTVLKDGVFFWYRKYKGHAFKLFSVELS